MLTRPSLYVIKPFDGTQNFTFEFLSSGGDQVFANELEIYNNSTNAQVYTQKTTSFQFKHELIADTLTNGTEYKARIRTYNISNTYSAWSDYITFKCLSMPILNFTNFDTTTGGENLVKNQSFSFIGTYTQNESELLQSCKYLLYDEHDILISQSSDIFTTDGSSLSYEFSGLENQKYYYIQLKVLTQNELETSKKVKFFVEYVAPKVQNLITLVNDSENANININTEVIRVLFKTLDGTITYENDEWINLKNGSIYTDIENGLKLEGNWTLKMWLKGLEDSQEFLIMYGDNNETIKLIMYDNTIHLYKTIQDFEDMEYHIYSESLETVSQEDTVFIYVQNNGLYMDVKAEKII